MRLRFAPVLAGLALRAAPAAAPSAGAPPAARPEAPWGDGLLVPGYSDPTGLRNAAIEALNRSLPAPPIVWPPRPSAGDGAEAATKTTAAVDDEDDGDDDDLAPSARRLALAGRVMECNGMQCNQCDVM